VRMLFIFFIIPIPAWLVLIWWFFWQLVAALPELTNGADLTGGVAVWAHVGGFLTGVLLVKFFENRHLVVRRTRPA
jgi:membrane associated rhomboid family serine protease